ncbi:MAG TPA: aminoacyl-tRNA hydrolase [Desulfotomaculum sp.]|nr:aminoacyl-tRNA hydrolase [Desulfotomaculum sp.]
MKLVVGLGNPGPEYVGTRHNVGFAVLDRLASIYGAAFKKTRLKALVAVIRVDDLTVTLAKPQTFMNLSGRAVRSLLQAHRLSPDVMLMVYDDLDLRLGQLRLLPRGSSGGHKGAESVIAAVGTTEFPRLRIGIGRPDGDAADYVLSPFLPAEAETASAVIDRAVAAVECVIREDLARAMNKFNRRW